MPYKLRNNRRHKFKKTIYKITNWREYNQALINRGSITLWLSPEIIKAWRPKKRKQKLQGGQFKYSDIAIEAAAYVKAALHMPYRETQGFLISILNLIDLSLPVPNYTTICRRIAKLDLPQLSNITDDKNINIVIDSTGLKIFGADQWHEEKHGLKKRRQWRKLHLTIDRDSHAIIAQELTTNSESDDSQVAPMLENIAQNITHFAADKAYDKFNVYQAVHDMAGNNVTIAIPPIKNAIVHDDKSNDFGSRNHNVAYIDEHGSYSWQSHSDYNFRALGEVAMFRYKTIIGDKLYSRKLNSQKVESRIGCVVLNKMTALGMPRSVKVKVAA